MGAVEQDPVKVAPHVYKSLFENKRVRLLEVRMKPGQKSSMHSHPAYVIYPLGPAKAKFTSPGGESVEIQLRAGEVMWRDPESHAVENVGPTDAHVVLIELK